jgi:hypothetical protein
MVDGEWWIVDWDDNPIMRAPKNIKEDILKYASNVKDNLPDNCRYKNFKIDYH